MTEATASPNDRLKAAIRAVLKHDPECPTDRVIKQAAATLIREPEWTARTDPRCQFPTYLSYSGPHGNHSFSRLAIRWSISDVRTEVSG